MKRTDAPALFCAALLLASPACSGGESTDQEDAAMDASVDLNDGDGSTQPGPEDTDASVGPDAPDASETPDSGVIESPAVSAEWPLPAFNDTAIEDTEIGRADVRIVSEEDGLRAYSLASTASLRAPMDGAGVSSPRVFSEKPGAPYLRSGHTLFDALFAMALEEARENSVDSISDGAFNNGQGVDCGGCFETGRNWHYVWTRDTAFAVDLALASVDPSRSRRSLEFKLSERRSGGDTQIVQDTGTGGSWPVSTDRVSWALGARALLGWLDGDERTAFRDKAFEAIRNTLEHDRATIHDARDGLYSGEQSFLDWREQTYPAWTADDPAQIAMSKSLSTNLLHLNAMRLAAELATEKGETETAARYQLWAESLATRIRAHFLLEDGRLSTFSTNTLDPAPTEQFDALSIAFAVEQGVISPEEAARAVAAYPHTGKGPPTIWPQQQATPIYHNRSFWPFVVGYWIDAARQVRNDRAVSFGVWSLVRSAALNLSNMENFELMSGKAWFDDGDPAMSGPVVNSQRQLWSVAGYLSMVQSTIFGVEAALDGVRVQPFVTRHLRHAFFSASDTIALRGLNWRGKALDIEILLPPVATSADGLYPGAYEIASVALNGQPLADPMVFLTTADLAASNTIAITLAEPATVASAPWTFIPPAEIFADGGWRKLFAPKAPTIPDLGAYLDNGQIKVSFSAGESDTGAIVHDVFRDGVRVAKDLDGSLTSWVDTTAGDHAQKTRCYSVQSRFKGSNNASQHARAACYWGEWDSASWRIQEFFPASFSFFGGSISEEHGRTHLGNSWGDDGHFAEVEFTADFDGDHFVQLVYANGTGALNTSVTCGVKEVRVFDTATATLVATGYLALPTLGGDWSIWKESTLARVALEKGKTYRVRVGSDENDLRRAINMSAFQHFADYTGNGGNGGVNGELNHVNIAQIKILALGESSQRVNTTP